MDKISRKIKFRVWNRRYNSFSEPLEDWDSEIIEIHDSPSNLLNAAIDRIREDEDLILQQFTGFLDRYGREIYEGDICDAGIVIGEVEYSIGGFRLASNQLLDYLPNNPDNYDIVDVKVVGNIFENPELLN